MLASFTASAVDSSRLSVVRLALALFFLAGFVALPGQAAAQVQEYCYTAPGAVQVCYETLAEAEAAMRAAEHPYLRLGSTSESGNPLYFRRNYVSDDQVPEMDAPGYMVGGWNAANLGCSNVAFVDGNNQGYCADESEAVAGWVANRMYHLGHCGYQYTVAGSQSVPNALYGAQTGYAHFTIMGENGGRHIDESWLCPGWGEGAQRLYQKTSVTKTIPLTCPAGYSLSPHGVEGGTVWPRVCRSFAQPYILVRRVQGQTCPTGECGNGNGENQRREPDFEFAGETFERTYRSLGQISQGNVGGSWNHSMGARINGPTIAPVLVESDGSMIPFVQTQIAGGYTHFRVRGLSDRPARWSPGKFEIFEADGSIRTFDGTGRLASRIHPADPARNVAYAYDADGFLSQATDGLGRVLSFHYDEKEFEVAGVTHYVRLLTEIVQPDGQVTEYDYDDEGNLTSVTHPDGSVRTYHYGESAFVAVPSPTLLTGISDNGVRYATYTYDAQGRMTSSKLAGDVQQRAWSFVDADEMDETTPNGLVRRYTFDASLERRVLSIVDSIGTIEYDYSSGLRTESRDRAGVRTSYTYDAQGLVATMTEANGTADARTTTYTRDSFGRVLATAVAAGSATVAKSALARDADGRVTAACQYDPNGANAGYVCGSAADAPAGVRQTTFAYCSAADAAVTNSKCPFVGQLKSVDGPLAGNTDTTTYLYRPTTNLNGCGPGTGNCFRKGELHTVTDGFGRVTTLNKRDLAGRVVTVTDPNGVVTNFEYDAAGRMTKQIVRGATSATDANTVYAYDTSGVVERITSPDGSWMQFGYDAARRLTSVEDALGNRIVYSLDGAGNRFLDETKDAGGVVRREVARLFDDLGRLETLADADANATDYTYDLAGNVDTATDALGRTTDNAYDALGRLRESIANVAGTGNQRAQSQFGYDALDHLTSVIDPKGLTTTYGYDGLGNQVSLVSPDTGTTTFGYDAAGNRTSALDARGVQTYFGYDRLHRLMGIDRPSAGQDVTFTWDTVPGTCQTDETFGIGRLGTMTDSSGSTQYCYDRRGNLVRKAQTVTSGTGTRTLRYAYDLSDNVTTITYPSGATVTYTRDASGRITGVSGKPTSTAASVTILSDIDYAPFGPATLYTFGNGRTLAKNYDLNYGIDTVDDNATGGLSIDLGLDDVGNVTAIDETLATGAVAARTVQYDALDRLTALKNGGTTQQGFSYDATGNRLSKASPSTATYTYPATSHHLTAVAGTARTYDAIGNTLTNGVRFYTYDDSGRMVQYGQSGSVTREYQHNGRGERVAKTQPGTTSGAIYFVYDEVGHLIGEYNQSGTRLREYVWVEDTLVAIYQGHASTSYQFVLTDHLGTPRAVVLPTTNAIVWRWDLTGSAFGDHSVANDPDGDGAAYTQNLRYPGQYADAESGHFYNYFRDYDPATGRYLESDPIGLSDGPSTFSYVGSRPLGSIDPSGLNERYDVNLGHGWKGSVDVNNFGPGGSASYEIHVFDHRNREVGMYGPNGWFDKHGHSGRPANIPLDVETQCNGAAVDVERRIGMHPPKGAPRSRGLRWRRVGQAAGAAIGAASGAASAVEETTHQDSCSTGVDLIGDDPYFCELGR